MSLATEIRTNLLNSFKARNIKEYEPFNTLIKTHSKLLDNYQTIKEELNNANLKIKKLEHENLELVKIANPSVTSTISQEKIHQLEESLLKAKDEVIDLQKRLVDQSQQVITLNKQLKDSNDELSMKEAKILESENRNELLKRKINDLENKLSNYEEAAKLWHDEKVEQEVQYNCLIQKYEKLTGEYTQVLAQSLKIKEEHIKMINEQNERDIDRRKKKLQDDLHDAVNTTTQQDVNLKEFISNPVRFIGGFIKPSANSLNINMNDSVTTKPTLTYCVQLVSKPACKFDCHDGEINAVKFHKNGKFFATGGGDRKIKLWEYKDGKTECFGSLIGSNASIASIDIDNDTNLIAGTSFDFACRLWSLNDNRLKMASGDLQPTITLTGHTNKVLTGKFLGTKIVTGSHDRTLKVWDLVQKACMKTLFAGSSCNDAVTVDSQCIVSGHFDKKIRFWDIRADQTQCEILLQGKVTSLDISSDRNYVLANTRDENALKYIDVRMNQVVKTYCHEDLKTSCDWSKAIISPDIENQYLCAGTADGNLIFWNKNNGKVEKILKEHNSSVLSLAWHPQGNYLVSCDSKKKAIVWE